MKKKLGMFLVLAFGIDWALWLATAAAAGPISEGAAVWNVVAPVSMFGPLVAALAVRPIGGDDIDRGWRPRLRGNVRSYLAAWFAPAALAITGATLYFLAFPGDFDGSASAYSQAAQAQLGVGPDQVPLVLAVQVISGIVLAPLFNMLLAIGEEAGWRGFLFPALQGFLSKKAAAVASGLIWGAWHAPLIAMGYNYGSDYPGFPVAGIAMMMVACAAFGTFLCYLREQSGSVWTCALAHGAFNATAGVGLYVSFGASTIMGPSPLGLVGFVPSLVLAVWCVHRLSVDAA